jgi:peroxiredoxin
MAAQTTAPDTGPWSGIIVNSTCTPEQGFNEAAECTAAVPGAKLALYDDTTRKIYVLNPQERITSKLGEIVTVRGVADGGAIQFDSIVPLTSIGLPVGRKAPEFSARDQFGELQSLDTLKGPNGTAILFFRSADWWPYCKAQLVQLQTAIARFKKQGIGLAAISYDSVEILKYFTDKHKITFPMLADPNSETIRAYGVLNTEALDRFKGMARPGFFFIDNKGVIREKFFEARYRERLSGNNVITKLFPELGEEVTDTVEAPHLQVALEQSDRTGVPGSMITLTAEVRLPPDVHVYAPGTKGYKPIKLAIDSIPEMDFKQVVYPHAKILFMPSIKERVPVFEGTFHIRQDIRVNTTGAFASTLGTDGKIFTISGKLEYQACDSKICFLPTFVPVQWKLQVLPLDRNRAPDAIQHK